MTSAAADAAVRCQVCRSEIWFGVTANGKQMPLDTVPTEAGNVVIESRSAAGITVRVLGKGAPRPVDEPVYMPHFVTCARRLRVLQGGRA